MRRTRWPSRSETSRSPVAVEGQAVRQVEIGGGGGLPVAVEPRGARARNGGDHARDRVDAAHAVIAAVGDERVPLASCASPAGRVERSHPRQLAVAEVVGRIAAGAVDRAGGRAGARKRGEARVRRVRAVDGVPGRVREEELARRQRPEVGEPGQEERAGAATRSSRRGLTERTVWLPSSVMIRLPDGSSRAEVGSRRHAAGGGAAVPTVPGLAVADHGADRRAVRGIDLRAAAIEV